MNLLIFRHGIDIHSVHCRSEKHTRMQTFTLSYVVFRTLQSTQEWLVAFFVAESQYHLRKTGTGIWRITLKLDSSMEFIAEKKPLALRNVFLRLG